jgi:2-oxoglutarate dehydrogenase E2 component (dihydrolipoamide succinyltransferase)
MQKIQGTAKVIEGKVGVKPMMYLGLSQDHSIADSKGAVIFLVKIKKVGEWDRRECIRFFGV